jgi:NAD(P)H-dependent flavin oxidoreductase YrpB (nitropropane dioxygenase family)
MAEVWLRQSCSELEQSGSEQDLLLLVKQVAQKKLSAGMARNLFPSLCLADVPDSVVNSDFDSAIVTTVFTGRPLRAQSNPYLEDWEKNRQAEIKDLSSRGIVPLEYELDKLHSEGKLTEEIEDHVVLRYVPKITPVIRRTQLIDHRPMGIVAGLVTKLNQPAGEIVKEISDEALALLRQSTTFIGPLPSKL